jgi:hypothetical protein
MVEGEEARRLVVRSSRLPLLGVFPAFALYWWAFSTPVAGAVCALAWLALVWIFWGLTAIEVSDWGIYRSGPGRAASLSWTAISEMECLVRPPFAGRRPALTVRLTAVGAHPVSPTLTLPVDWDVDQIRLSTAQQAAEELATLATQRGVKCTVRPAC